MSSSTLCRAMPMCTASQSQVHPSPRHPQHSRAGLNTAFEHSWTSCPKMDMQTMSACVTDKVLTLQQWCTNVRIAVLRVAQSQRKVEGNCTADCRQGAEHGLLEKGPTGGNEDANNGLRHVYSGRHIQCNHLPGAHHQAQWRARGNCHCCAACIGGPLACPCLQPGVFQSLELVCC